MAGSWAHDYVPLNMTAALEKAHGSRKGALAALRRAREDYDLKASARRRRKG